VCSPARFPACFSGVLRTGSALRRCSGDAPRQSSGRRSAARLGESRGEVGVGDCFQESRRGAAGGGAASASFGCSFPCEIKQKEGISGCVGMEEEG
jgi:hypothetical protein